MKKLLLFIGLVALTLSGSAQCSASFVDTNMTWTSNPYDVFFTNTSTGYTTGSGWTTFYWTFSGGGNVTGASTANYSNSPDTIGAEWPGPGTYEVCLTLIDSFANCWDTYCDSITVTGPPVLTASVSGTGTTCGSCNGSATASVSGGTAPYTYAWSNGATTASITGLCNGTYSVTVTDNNGSTSADSLIISGSAMTGYAYISGTTVPCAADSSTTLTAFMISGTAGTYLWNTGETTQSITVTSNGTYSVTITDTNGCSDADTFSVLWSAPIVANETITHSNGTCNGSISLSPTGGSGMNPWGYVWSNSAMTSSISSLCAGTYTVTISDSNCLVIESYTIIADTCNTISGNLAQGGDAVIYLITEDTGYLYLADSTLTDPMGDYSFSNVCPGTYYVKGALLPANTNYYSYIPTYNDSAALWSGATAIVKSASSISNVDFSLISMANTGGPGFVGGSIVGNGANKGDEGFLPNKRVMIVNLENGDMRSTVSDEDGLYAFDDLPEGEYEVYVDIMNKTSYPHVLTIDETQLDFESANFIVYNDRVEPETPSGLGSVDVKHSNIFPNPSNGYLTISMNEEIDRIEVFNTMGQKVKDVSVNGLSIQTLTISDLASGQYMVRVSSEAHTDYHHLIKK